MEFYSKVKEIDQTQLIDVLNGIKRYHGVEKYCFLLGAGASRSSGIPTGVEFAKRWHKELEKNSSLKKELEDWKDEISFDEERIGDFYFELYKKRFEINRSVAIDEFINSMDEAKPSIGYTILSQILVNEKHNIVITTNFDSLVEDAIRLFTPKKPITFGHESLINYVPLDKDKPIIIKLHRDLFFDPINEKDKSFISIHKWTKKLNQILDNYNLLVIGYAGNDESLINFLKKKKKRKNIYWCKLRNEKIADNVKDVLRQNDFIINIDDFDELMCNIYVALKYDILNNVDNPKEHPLLTNANNTILELNNKIQDVILKKLENSEDEIIDCEYFKLVIRDNRTLINKRDFYLALIKIYYDKAKIYYSYANYLFKNTKYYDDAEEYLKKSIEKYLEQLALDIKNEDIKSNLSKCYNDFGKFYCQLKNAQKAKENYLLSYKYDSDNVENLCELAIFFYQEERENESDMDLYFNESIRLKPKNMIFNFYYIDYLIIIKKDFYNANSHIESLISRGSLEHNIKCILWFFRYAHLKEYMEEAEKILEELLKKEIDIIWNLRPHIELAFSNNHPNEIKLNEFANAILQDKIYKSN